MRFFLIILLLSLNAKASLFGEENFALAKIIAGQVEEIKILSEAVGVADDQLAALKEVNQGVEKLTQTLEAVDEIQRRSQGLDPRGIKRMRDLTDLIYEARSLKKETESLLLLKTLIVDESLHQSEIQSQTAYAGGGELIKNGIALSQESQNASPGRAAQITASAASSSVVGQGIELQTLSQIAQIQGLHLEMAKSQDEKEANIEKMRVNLFKREMQKRSGLYKSQNLASGTQVRGAP